MKGGKWLKSSLTFLYQVLTKMESLINKIQEQKIRESSVCFHKVYEEFSANKNVHILTSLYMSSKKLAICL